MPISAAQRRQRDARLAGAGQPQATGLDPQMGQNQHVEFQPHAQQVLSGYYLEQGNPYTQGLLDRQRREAEATYGAERARLDEAAGGAGRFGGSVYRSLAGTANANYQQNLAEQQNATLAALHEAERGRMMTALGQLGGFETAAADRAAQERMAAEAAAAQRSAASASAAAQLRATEMQTQAQMDMLAQQLGFSREELEAQMGLSQQQLAGQIGMHGLDAWTQRAMQQAQHAYELEALGQNLGFGREQLATGLLGQLGQLSLGEAGLLGDIAGGLGDQQLGALGMAGQMGLGYGQQQLGTLGMVPGLEQAGYYGLGQALQGQGALGAQQGAADRARYANELARWQHETMNPQNALGDYFGILAGLGSLGGTADTHGMAAPNTQIPSANPIAGALMGGLGGFLTGRGLQQPAAQPVGTLPAVPGMPFPGGLPFFGG